MRVKKDIIEEILERLPVKSLLRFKLVSKEWKMIIESQYFKKRHMIRRQSQEPDLLIIHEEDDDVLMYSDELMTTRMVLDSIPNQNLQPKSEFSLDISIDDVSMACDGLLCIYHYPSSILVANPSIGWTREVPRARVQKLVSKRYNYHDPNFLGFGKDITTGTYKLVWLYNSAKLNLKGETTCEVFDFNINTWRYVESSPYRTLDDKNTLYVDGSLYWFIYKSDSEIKILSFDCHTEIFQVISESPITQEDESQITMCNLNNRVCVSEKKWPTQDIWTLNGLNMTWDKIYSLDLSFCRELNYEMLPIACPVAIMKNKKLLLYDKDDENTSIVVYDLETKSYSVLYDAESMIYVAPYFESLVSII